MKKSKINLISKKYCLTQNNMNIPLMLFKYNTPVTSLSYFPQNHANADIHFQVLSIKSIMNFAPYPSQ